MTNQALFSSKDKSKKSECRLLQFLFGASRVNLLFLFHIFRADYNDPEYLRLTDMMDQLLQRQGIKNPLNFFPALRVLPQGKKVLKNFEFWQLKANFVLSHGTGERKLVQPVLII